MIEKVARAVLFAIMLAPSAHGQEVKAARPRVGLALGGGSARGIAHAGVLQWLEEHRIPVDRIAGTSTGALMGASYATGLSSAAIQEMLRHADWETILRPDIPFGLRSFRRKEDDRDYAIKLEAGLREGFRIQSGLNPGHHLSLLASRVLLPYSGVSAFDDLPIPFRCIATDLASGQVVVFDRGPLAPAVRASMALPGTYDPMRINGRLLADGGILNNVPVDVAKDMGAEVVIAVRTGPKSEEEPEETIGGIANRAITLMMQALERPRLRRADIVLVPDLDGLSAADFRKSDELAARGYRAAEAQKEALLRLALDEDAWAEYREAINARRVAGPTEIAFVQVTGVSDGAAAQIAHQLNRHIGHKPLTPEIEADLNRLVGLGRYASATYGLRSAEGTTGLGVDFREKPYGPPFVRFSLDVNNENKDANLNVGSRLTLMDVTGLGSEWRIDTALGSTLGLATEFYQPIGGERPVRGGAFLAPSVSYFRRSEKVYGGSELVAIYGRRRAAAGLDLGWNSKRRTRFRFGYEAAMVRDVARVGDPVLPQSAGREQSAHARLDFDGRNAPVLASRGARFGATTVWFLEAPDAAKRFGSAEARFLAALSPAKLHGTLTLTVEGGASFGGTPPALYQFTLGGPNRLSGFPQNAFRGPRYFLSSLGYRVAIGRLPKLVGDRLYLDTAVETGGIRRLQSAETAIRTSVTAGVAADTFLGPFFAGVSAGQGGALRVSFIIGRLVR